MEPTVSTQRTRQQFERISFCVDHLLLQFIWYDLGHNPREWGRNSQKLCCPDNLVNHRDEGQVLNFLFHNPKFRFRLRYTFYKIEFVVARDFCFPVVDTLKREP